MKKCHLLVKCTVCGLEGCTLQERIEVMKLMPGIAHLPFFGLVLYPGEESPDCESCSAKDIPIMDSKHVDSKFCKQEDING